MTGRYESRTWSPTSMGAAVAVNAGALTMLMFAAPALNPLAPPDTITAYPVPIESPPPPLPEPEPKPVERVIEAQPRPLPDPFVPKPVIDVVQPTGPVIATSDTMPTQPPPSGPAGTGTGGAAIDPPALPVLVGAVPDARYRDDFQPDYPPSERRMERDGVVTVRVHIDARGRVTAVEQVRATSDAFFNATRQRALARWRFKPATRDGVAVDSWREMTVRFEMAAL